MITLKDDIRDELIQKAIEAYQKASAPSSHYSVGAALLTESGEVVEGVNIENAVYPLTICAERVAIFKAVSEGHRSFKAIAVVTKNGGTPCGSCRQVMAEFGLDTVVYIADSKGKLYHTVTVDQLLPYSYGEVNLKED